MISSAEKSTMNEIIKKIFNNINILSIDKIFTLYYLLQRCKIIQNNFTSIRHRTMLKIDYEKLSNQFGASLGSFVNLIRQDGKPHGDMLINDFYIRNIWIRLILELLLWIVKCSIIVICFYYYVQYKFLC